MLMSADEGSSLLASTLQKMQLVPVPAKTYGNFYEGDCYIVLYVSAPTLVHTVSIIVTLSQSKEHSYLPVHGRFFLVCSVLILFFHEYLIRSAVQM